MLYLLSLLLVGLAAAQLEGILSETDVAKITANCLNPIVRCATREQLDLMAVVGGALAQNQYVDLFGCVTDEVAGGDPDGCFDVLSTVPIGVIFRNCADEVETCKNDGDILFCTTSQAGTVTFNQACGETLMRLDGGGDDGGTGSGGMSGSGEGHASGHSDFDLADFCGDQLQACMSDMDHIFECLIQSLIDTPDQECQANLMRGSDNEQTDMGLFCLNEFLGCSDHFNEEGDDVGQCLMGQIMQSGNEECLIAVADEQGSEEDKNGTLAQFYCRAHLPACMQQLGLDSVQDIGGNEAVEEALIACVRGASSDANDEGCNDALDNFEDVKFDCRTEEMWSEEKAAWCCENRDVGCELGCANANWSTTIMNSKGTSILMEIEMRVEGPNVQVTMSSSQKWFSFGPGSGMGAADAWVVTGGTAEDYTLSQQGVKGVNLDDTQSLQNVMVTREAGMTVASFTRSVLGTDGQDFDILCNEEQQFVWAVGSKWKKYHGNNRGVITVQFEAGDPFNCTTRDLWSDEKTEWCCENRNLGCTSECPAEAGEPGESCSTEGQRCTYGEECCCGECSHSHETECRDGELSFMHTDFCFGPCECPERQPQMGSECTFADFLGAACTYGEECCCGECSHSFEAQCSGDGQWEGFNTDFCEAGCGNTGTCDEGCDTWFDGCNTCGCENGRTTFCTEMFCIDAGEPKCLDTPVNIRIGTYKTAKDCNKGKQKKEKKSEIRNYNLGCNNERDEDQLFSINVQCSEDAPSTTLEWAFFMGEGCNGEPVDSGVAVDGQCDEDDDDTFSRSTFDVPAVCLGIDPFWVDFDGTYESFSAQCSLDDENCASCGSKMKNGNCATKEKKTKCNKVDPKICSFIPGCKAPKKAGSKCKGKAKWVK